MSRNDWERGTIKIPSNQWSAFKKALINHFNSQAETNYNLSITIYEKLLETSKHKRNYDYYQAITELLSLNAVRHGRWEDRKIHNSLLPLNASGKPKKPKAKDFPKKTNRDIRFGNYITIDGTRRTVTWNVDENNRACESARQSKMGRFLFILLDKIEWKRGSGGTIVGNDEYNREDSYEGGGANYTTAAYPPKEKSDRYRENS